MIIIVTVIIIISFLLLGGCWTIRCGYVAYAASKLRKRIVLQHSMDGRGRARTIGGHRVFPEDLQERLNRRMREWVRVVVQVSKAEFPEFEVVAAFGVFSLLAKERPFSLAMMEGSSETEQRLKASILRLAQVYKVSADDLEKQINDLRPAARNRFVSSGCGTFEAWAHAVKKVKKHHQTRQRHPVDALQIVLFAFATDGGSSSGVEQGFSKTMAAISSQQLKASEELEEDLTKLIVDYAHIGDKAILRLAQEVWRDEFGSARKSPAEPRFDMGCPRAKQPGSESQWLKRRRDSILAGSVSAASSGASSIDAIVVSEKHTQEIEFNKKKLLKKKAAAFTSGSLLANEADDTVKAAVQESNGKEKMKHNERLNESTRRADFVNARPLSPDELKSRTVFVDKDVETEHADALRTFVDTHRLNVVSQRVDADCFVVANPASPGSRIATVAALVGGYVASIGALLRGRGVCFHHALAKAVGLK